ncbi:RHS repeat-associated core domain-containing protein, partial [Chryseobacterium sp. MYb328]|uniref:RHS repeat-associated core domain-containing protein n=1 Tax=Chryseobacterium sp. MYb328 TaxID=2745231 RepID=UPI0030ADF836
NHIQGSLGTSKFGSHYSYKFNEKELQETGMYDYGWRQYFPDLGRWNGLDQLSENYLSASPYAYVLNNPVYYFDPDGRISAAFAKEIYDSPDGTVWTNNGYGGFSNNWGNTMDYAGNLSNANMASGVRNESDGIHINIPNVQLQGKSSFSWGLQIQSHVNRYMEWWNGKSDFAWDRTLNAGRYNDKGGLESVSILTIPFMLLEAGMTEMLMQLGVEGRNAYSTAQVATFLYAMKAPQGVSGEAGIIKSGNNASKGGGIYIPKTPLSQQKVAGWDIPLPDPLAGKYPHTTLGGKIGSDGILYRQSATFTGGSWPLANGKVVPWSRVDWTTHGRPLVHPNPHQHIFNFNNGKNWQYGKAVPFP